MGSQPIIEPVAGPFDLGEGPHWDEDKRILYFVDLHRREFIALDPATKKFTKTYLKNGSVGAVVPVAGRENTFVGASGTDFVKLQWDPTANNAEPGITILSTVDVDRPNNRFNDGKVDPAGRFWAGTMHQKDGKVDENQGALYRLEKNGTPVKVLPDVTISNGLCWSLDHRVFYYVDSPTCEVFAYDYEISTGSISNKRVVFRFEEYDIPGIPDGMTIDRAGHLWLAVWDGGRVLEIDPESKTLVRTVTMPVSEITSVIFGGPNYDILYVTSSKWGLSSAELEKQPLAGYVFAVHGLGAIGTKSLNAQM